MNAKNEQMANMELTRICQRTAYSPWLLAHLPQPAALEEKEDSVVDCRQQRHTSSTKTQRQVDVKKWLAAAARCVNNGHQQLVEAGSSLFHPLACN
jgi:hypothetical protein